MKYFLFIFFIIPFCLASQKNVLIIGNSLMYYNKMPKNFSNLLNQKDNSFSVDNYTHSGFSLRDHLDNYFYPNEKSINFIKMKRYINQGLSEERLKRTYRYKGTIDTITKSSLQILLEKKKYDFIFIQEHGSYIESELALKYIASKSLIRLKKILNSTNNKNAKLIYFTEYPDKKSYKTKTKRSETPLLFSYDTATCKKLTPSDTNRLSKHKIYLFDTIDYLNNPLAQIERYTTNLKKLQKVSKFEIAPTAIIFNILKTKYPRWKMYRMGGHPSKISSFIFSSVYYRIITGKNIKISSSTDINICDKKAKIIFNEVNKYFNTL